MQAIKTILLILSIIIALSFSVEAGGKSSAKGALGAGCTGTDCHGGNGGDGGEASAKGGSGSADANGAEGAACEGDECHGGNGGNGGAAHSRKLARREIRKM